MAKIFKKLEDQSPLIGHYPQDMSMEDRWKQEITSHLPEYILSGINTGEYRKKPLSSQGDITDEANKIEKQINKVHSTTIQFDDTQQSKVYKEEVTQFDTTQLLDKPVTVLQILKDQGVVTENNIQSTKIQKEKQKLVAQGQEEPEYYSTKVQQGETKVKTYKPLIEHKGPDITEKYDTLIEQYNAQQALSKVDNDINQGSVTIIKEIKDIKQWAEGDVSIAKFQDKRISPEKESPYIPPPPPLPPIPPVPPTFMGEAPNVAKYELDRLMAIVTPEIKHGTKEAASLGVNTYIGELNKVDGVSNPTNPNPSADDSTNVEKNLQDESETISLQESNRYSYKKTDDDDYSSVFFGERTQTLTGPGAVDQTTHESFKELSKYEQKYLKITTDNETDKSNESKVKEAQQSINKDRSKKYTSSFQSGTKYTETIKPDNQISIFYAGDGMYDDLNDTDGYNPSNLTTDNGNEKDGADLILLKFKPSPNMAGYKKSIQFRAYISKFDDNFDITYSDVKYIGRPDTMRQFSNTNRNASLTFKVVADGRSRVGTLKTVWAKINYLIKISAVPSINLSTQQIISPFVYLTVGDYFKEVPVIITNLKPNIDMTETTWEIDKGYQLPTSVDINMSMIVLGAMLKQQPVMYSSTANYISAVDAFTQ